MSYCDQYANDIFAAADAYGIDRGIALAQMRQESGCNPNVCSQKGACGIAQFMPATAARFNLTDRRDVAASLNAWGQYMSWLLRRYNGDYSKALAGYNAGEGNVDKYGGVPPFAETRNYVASILNNAGSVPAFGGVPGDVPVNFRSRRVLRFIRRAYRALCVGGCSEVWTFNRGGSAYCHAVGC